MIIIADFNCALFHKIIKNPNIIVFKYVYTESKFLQEKRDKKKN